MSNNLETRKNQIKLILEAYYNDAQFSFLKEIPFDKLLDKTIKTFLESDLSIDQVNEKIANNILEKKEYFEKNAKLYDKSIVEKNHKVIYSKLEEFTKLLNNASIDYQLTGALCGYLKYNEESGRCHKDINININEKDIDKLKKVCEVMELSFNDNRYFSKKVLKNGIPFGEQEIIAFDKNNSFSIGAFPFERLADGTIITKGYYHDSNKNSCCKEDIISSQFAELIFGKDIVDINGQSVCITSPEYIYILKSYTRNEKDQYDLKFLDKHIDKDKVKQYKELIKTDIVTQNSLVSNDPTIVKQATIDLQNTLYTTIDLEKDMKKVTRKKEYNKQNREITKQLKKINPNMKMATGSISIVSIILALLVVFAVLLVGLIIYTMVK